MPPHQQLLLTEAAVSQSAIVRPQVKELGAFYTDEAVADFLAAWAIRDGPRLKLALKRGETRVLRVPG
jgi:hypothetical protein